jgi:hypothetical protein
MLEIWKIERTLRYDGCHDSGTCPHGYLNLLGTEELSLDFGE